MRQRSLRLPQIALLFAVSASVASVVLPARIACADGVTPSFDARTYRPVPDAHAGLVMESVPTPGPGAFTLGAVSSYAFRPISLTSTRDGSVTYPVEHLWALDLLTSIGIGKRTMLGLSIPMVLAQGGDSQPEGVSSSGLPTTSLGDIGLHGKAAFLDNSDGGFGLAATGLLTLPTGNQAGFAGEGAATIQLKLIADYNLGVASIQGSLGFKLRTESRTWPDASLGGYTFGDEIPWAIGIRLRPDIFHIDREDRQLWEVGVRGSLPAGPVGPFGAGEPGSKALSPVLLAASDRIGIGKDKDTYLLAGAEVGLNDAVGTPAFRFVVGLGWAPREHDKDHDGIRDDVDQCEDVPEDKDGYEDSDGCPEIDNDDDGIIDREDKCPLAKGVPSSDPSKNGCPPEDKDGDGISDLEDACPTTPGPKNPNTKFNGCPSGDKDGDGIPDFLDKCPEAPEDKDGVQDDDGCPDPDDDGDGVADKEDACPKLAGEPSTDPKFNGCPNPDRDGDTFLNDKDECPDAAEAFNGIKDDDGCPDEGGKPLVTIDAKNVVRFANALKLGGTADAPTIDDASVPTLRALALELQRHRDWTLAVGAKPAAGTVEAHNAALLRAITVVDRILGWVRRDGAVETVGWDAVKAQPTASSGTAGIGFLLLVAPPPPATGTTPATPPKPPVTGTTPATPPKPPVTGTTPATPPKPPVTGTTPVTPPKPPAPATSGSAPKK